MLLTITAKCCRWHGVDSDVTERSKVADPDVLKQLLDIVGNADNALSRSEGRS